MITRFAPSPTGALHLGHAYAAIFAHDLAAKTHGTFLVRIEDIDRVRCRLEWESAIFDDLRWLGLIWEQPVRRQSEHMADYLAAISKLGDLLYPCFCSRKDIAAEIARSPSAPHGPEGALYPGTCRALQANERVERIEGGDAYALRLDMAEALRRSSDELRFFEKGRGPNGETGWVVAAPQKLGDVVIARKDVSTSYHLAVVVDDGLQQISCVTRGGDLFFATHLHRFLQSLLGLPAPEYHHHDIILDETGRRLATRHKAVALKELRRSGVTPAEIRSRLGLELGG